MFTEILLLGHIPVGSSYIDCQVGDVITVVDCGGGTADLISYEVDQLIPTLEVTEVVPGTGTPYLDYITLI